MLGVGWTEMLVIGVVALIVIGPKELPAVMRRVGQFAGTIRRMGQDFQRELNKTTGLNEITNLRNSVTAPLKATADAIRKEFNATTASGTVVPSGAIKPADPTAQSVVDEIKAQAGMTPAAPAVSAVPAVSPAPALDIAPTPAVAAVAATPAAEAVTVSLKKPRTPRVKPVPAAAAVETADLPPVAPAPKRTRKVAAIESPGPAEALPPVEVATPAKRTRKAAASVTVAEPEADQKPKRTRRVAAKPADSTTDES
jgi:sec-independent protein translocase protein TatB